MKKEKNYSLKVGDKDIQIKINKLAQEANGSAIVQSGETVVLVTAVMSDKPKEDLNFFPLSVEYEEHYWAAGKIKGSRFIKRKGRPTDEAILSARLIDRSIRPLFPKGFKNEVQVVVNVLSYDFKNDPRQLAFIGVGAALEASNIPFEGPLAGVCIGENEKKLIINPTLNEQECGNLTIIVAGVKDNVSMIEAGSKEVPEEMIVEAIQLAQAENKKISESISQIGKDYNIEKYQPEISTIGQETVLKLKEKYLSKFQELFDNYQEKKKYEKDVDRLIDEILEKELETFKDSEELAQMEGQIKDSLKEIQKELIQDNILTHKKRLGGRKMDEVRDLSIEVGVLPRTHGSAIFKRGETQSLTVATLGAPGSELILDNMTEEKEATQRYMHFYSFPPYSVGEVGFFRGPGRREIGHGALGEKSLASMIPSKDDFPYTIIMNTEIMASDGSTSMASVCGSTLALMDAGVPIKNPVAGVAMGLVVDKIDVNNYEVLTDLCANEDFAGHMDFKVAGTEKGINALQMDIKVKGLTLEILKDALEKAKKGRMHILNKMLEAIDKPRETTSPYAPRVDKMKIHTDKIRDLIGPGGKNINSIIDVTGVQIDIEDDGTVFVASANEESMKQAKDLIIAATKVPQAGEEYDAKITRVLNFGAFAEFLPGQEGLIHISKLGQGKRVENVTDVVNVGDKVKIKIEEVDQQGRFNLLFLGKKD